MKAASVPKPMAPANTRLPPRLNASAVEILPSAMTSGMNSALSKAERMLAVRMAPVSSRNSAALASSRTRVFVVMAPMMPSLNAPVMRLFVLRTARWYLSIRFWKITHSAARTGVMHSTSRPSFQFMASSTATMPTANTPAHIRSTRLQAIISDSRAISLTMRAISQPTEVVS